ncbi:hypothetical protein E2C01_078365 [Portunus trituberculatus]|uniref:Uncharacterized protein n=1 Tax=Portunus trituberculatus TaxID=210409 RepID=A0A5B7IGT6_PORTR|nr:hypothetical protein [Portunus trituberculatus]
MLRKHTICLKKLNISKMGYFRVFQRFMHQHSELHPKHTICLRKWNI